MTEHTDDLRDLARALFAPDDGEARRDLLPLPEDRDNYGDAAQRLFNPEHDDTDE